MGVKIEQLVGFIEKQGGSSVLERVLEMSDWKGIDIRPKVVYSEENFQKLLGTAIKELGLDTEKAEEEFAKYIFPVLEKEFSGYLETAADAKTFLRRVPRVHLEFPRVIGSEAKMEEKHKVVSEEKDKLTFFYKSPNKLCILLKTLINLSLKHYGEKGKNSETKCMKRGDDHCEIAVTFLGEEHPLSF